MCGFPQQCLLICKGLTFYIICSLISKKNINFFYINNAQFISKFVKIVKEDCFVSYFLI